MGGQILSSHFYAVKEKVSVLGIFDGVLLACDYDGTLCGVGSTVLPRDLAAIRRFQREGGKFLVATGRGFSTFVQQAKQLPLNYPTLISNGATFCEMDSGRILFQHDLPDRAAEDMQVMAQEFPGVAMEAYHGEEVYCYRPNRYTHWHMELVKSTYTESPLEDMPTPWLKVLLEGEREELAQLRDAVLERWSDFYECIFSNENLLELTGKNVHKGAGVLEAAQMLGVAPEHIYCVGDNDNDMPMLRAAKIGFAPAGSVAAGRNYPGVRVVRGCDDGCVESVIEILQEIYG